MVQKIIAIDLGFLFILNSYGKIIVLMAGRTGLNISCSHRTFPFPVVKRIYSTEVFSNGICVKKINQIVLLKIIMTPIVTHVT